MKRLLSCILLAVFLVSFCGYSEKANSSDNTKKAVSETDKKRKSYDMKEEEFVKLLSYYVNYHGMVLQKESQGEGLTVYVFYQENETEWNRIFLFHNDDGNLNSVDTCMKYIYDENYGKYAVPMDVCVISDMLIANLHGKDAINLWERFYPEDAPKEEEGTFAGSKYRIRYEDKELWISFYPKQ